MLKIDIQLFGGRGAMSGRASRNISVNVGSSTSLISKREENQRKVDEALAAFKSVNDEYGYVIQDMQVAALKGGWAKKSNRILWQKHEKEKDGVGSLS